MRLRLLIATITLFAAPLAAGVTPAAAALPRPAAVVTDGALVDSLVTGGVPAPVAVSALPDGRAVVLGKGGTVRIIKNGVLLPAAALTLNLGACTNSERGLLGFTADRDFSATGLVFVYYTHPNAAAPGGCVNRVSRFRMAGDTINRSTEVVLLDNVGSPAGNHNGGDVWVGNDGLLYVSVGDGGCDPRNNSGCAGGNDAAQDLSLLNGKILRVDRLTGAPAPGNPFSGVGTAACRVRGNNPATPTTRCREIFAYGLRNPWRFAFDPNTGATKFVINDVGQGTREEVDLGIRGANYGWPVREGFCAQGVNRPCAGPPAGLVQPITDYSHVDTGSYITGGAFVPNGAWAKAYDGGYFFADGDPGKIFFRNSAGVVNYATPFATGVGSISDLSFVMDTGGWALYYVLPGSGQVRKISPNYAPPPSTGNLAYLPITPVRTFDSANLGTNSGLVRGGTTRLVRVAATRGTHRAALVNVTVVRPPAGMALTVWQARTQRPATPNALADRGAVVASAMVVPIDPDGLVSVHTTATVRVIVDVLGFFDGAPGGVSAAGRFVPVPPTRAVSTSIPADPTTNAYARTGTATASTVTVPVASRYGVVAGAQSVALIVHAVGSPSSTGGHVAVAPHGAALPATSNLNVNSTTDRRSNMVIVPIGAGGSIDLFLRNVSNVVVEVVGSFTGGSAASTTTGLFVLATPQRLVDTRSSLGLPPFAAAGTVAFDPPTVPANAVGVLHTAWMINPSAAASLTTWPDVGSGPTGVDLLAGVPGQARSVLAPTALSAGRERVTVGSATHLVVDLFGWFAG